LETTGLFDRRTFARMKRGSVLINTARGKLVVESDLVEALRSGQLSGAGLDVFEEEPPPANHPLFAFDQVVLAPHMGGADWLSCENMAAEAADCIVRLSRGEWPVGKVVNDDLKSDWSW
jgi:phosphoglycerate dehydrogenase-like enzyme